MTGISLNHPTINKKWTTEEKPICILTLDGDGVRGLSSLIILRGLMDRVAFARKISGHEPVSVRPSDYFDLIVGTGMGGISALFLGRLHMTVDEAISAYQKVAKIAFQPPSLLSRVFPFRPLRPPLLSQQLGQCVGNIVHLHLHDRDATLANPAGACRTAVLAGAAVFVDSPPHIFRSYATVNPASSFTVREVARAVVAVPGTSLSCSLGNPEIEYISASLVRYNNPAEVGISEVKNRLHSRIACLVSLGTGRQKIVQLGGPSKDLGRASVMLAQTSDEVHDRICRSELVLDKDYFRFNVTSDLEGIDTQDRKLMGYNSLITKITIGYMKAVPVATSLDNCARTLVGMKNV